MRRQCADYDVIFAALTVMNETRCEPPKPAKDVKNLAYDIAGRYPPNPDNEIVLPSGETIDAEVSKELTRLRIRDKARRLFDAENKGEVEPPEILTLRELLARPQPDVAWRLAGFQPANTRVMLSAQYKAGKTTLVGNLVRSPVDGDPWLGRFEVAAVGRVVILDFEMGENQLAAWLAAQGIENDDRITVIPMRGKASTFDVLDETTRSEWAQRLAGFDYLIIDPLRPILDALGLDEHRDGGRFLTAFDELCDQAGIPDNLVIHHMGHRRTGPRRLPIPGLARRRMAAGPRRQRRPRVSPVHQSLRTGRQYQRVSPPLRRHDTTSHSGRRNPQRHQSPRCDTRHHRGRRISRKTPVYKANHQETGIRALERNDPPSTFTVRRRRDTRPHERTKKRKALHPQCSSVRECAE